MKRLIEVIRVADDADMFKRKVNEFNETHSVFATQTTVVVKDNQLIFVAVIFYNVVEEK